MQSGLKLRPLQLPVLTWSLSRAQNQAAGKSVHGLVFSHSCAPGAATPMTSSPRTAKFLGIVLAVFAGSLAGVQSVAWMQCASCARLSFGSWFLQVSPPLTCTELRFQQPSTTKAIQEQGPQLLSSRNAWGDVAAVGTKHTKQGKSGATKQGFARKQLLVSLEPLRHTVMIWFALQA